MYQRKSSALSNQTPSKDCKGPTALGSILLVCPPFLQYLGLSLKQLRQMGPRHQDVSLSHFLCQCPRDVLVVSLGRFVCWVTEKHPGKAPALELVELCGAVG